MDFPAIQAGHWLSASSVLVDQGTSLPGAFKSVFPTSKVFNCKFHIDNNLPKYLTQLTKIQQDEFDKDYQHWINSASRAAFNQRYHSLQESYSQFPELCKHLADLYIIGDNIAMYSRRKSKGLHTSSSAAEVCHSIFKRKHRASRLIDAVKRSVSVAKTQKTKELFSEGKIPFVSAKYDQAQIGVYGSIINRVKAQYGLYANQWLRTEVARRQGLVVNKKLSLDDFHSFMNETASLIGNLPSHGNHVDDIPDDVIEAAKHNPKESIIYLVTKESTCKFSKRRKRILEAGEAILVYSKARAEYSCTCQPFGLKGIVCRHFLAAFAKYDDVYYSSRMWANRWAKKQCGNDETGINHNGDEIPLSDVTSTPTLTRNVTDTHQPPALTKEIKVKRVRETFERILGTLQDETEEQVDAVLRALEAIRSHVVKNQNRPDLLRTATIIKANGATKSRPADLYGKKRRQPLKSSQSRRRPTKTAVKA